MDQRFHLRLHLLAVRQDDLWRVGDDAAGRHAVERLLTDFYRLVHLLKAHHVARPHVALGTRRHIEGVLFIAGVGHVAAQVPVHTAGAQRRAGNSQSDCIFA